MLDGLVNDAVESVSLAHAIDHIDVFSASWGPTDDGMTVDGPKKLALEALEKGIHEVSILRCNDNHLFSSILFHQVRFNT